MGVLLKLVRSRKLPKTPPEAPKSRVGAVFGVFVGEAHFLAVLAGWGIPRGRRRSKSGRCRPTRSSTAKKNGNRAPAPNDVEPARPLGIVASLEGARRCRAKVFPLDRAGRP